MQDDKFTTSGASYSHVGTNGDSQDSAPSLLAALFELAGRADRFMCYKPPNMEPEWHPAYAKALSDALDTALSNGADPGLALEALLQASQELPDGVPWQLLRRCITAGLHADMDIGGGTPLLHYLLSRPNPPRLGGDETASTAAGGTKGDAGAVQPLSAVDATGTNTDSVERECPVSLDSLLQSAKPNLRGRKGATALHVVLACLLARTHFPVVADQVHQDGKAPDGCGNDSSGGFSSGAEGLRTGDAHELLLEAEADARRAAYARAAFASLLRAGWSAAARDTRGCSASDTAAVALRQCQADLEEVLDPRGLPHAALAEFVEMEQRGREQGSGGNGDGKERLQQLLRAREAGARAVVCELERIVQMAAAQRRPGVVVGAAVLLSLWVVLVAVFWQLLVAQQPLKR